MAVGLRVTDIVVSYGSAVVIDGLDLDAEPGELVVVTGDNGSGKSTLLKGLAGLHPSSFTSFEIGGEECPPESRKNREWTHSVTDEWMWFSGFTLRDHLQLVTPSASSDSIDESLDLFGLTDLADRAPSSLSSGQQQRAALSSVIVRPWRVLFLDEPEKRLDENYRQVLAEVLPSLIKDGVIVVATHAPVLFEESTTQTIHLGEE